MRVFQKIEWLLNFYEFPASVDGEESFYERAAPRGAQAPL